MTPAEQHLETRLRQVLSLDPDTTYTQESARDAIVTSGVGMCICARWPRVGGRLLTFSAFYAACYGVDEEGKAVRQKAKP